MAAGTNLLFVPLIFKGTRATICVIRKGSVFIMLLLSKQNGTLHDMIAVPISIGIILYRQDVLSAFG